MNRLKTLFAAMSLLTVMPAGPAAAAPPNPPDLGVVDFCKYDVPTNHPDLNLGGCVAFQSTNFRDNLNGLVPHICSFIEAVHPDRFYANYDTYDECIRDQAGAFL